MSGEVQISAFVSETTRGLLDRHVRATGVKKAHVVEQALLHYIQATKELPQDVIVPPRLVVSKETGEALLGRIARPAKPTSAMRELMGGD